MGLLRGEDVPENPWATGNDFQFLVSSPVLFIVTNGRSVGRSERRGDKKRATVEVNQ